MNKYIINDINISYFEFFSHYFFNSGYHFDGHRHDTWELNAVIDGELEITYDDSVFNLSAGHVFIGEPNVFHHNRLKDGKSVELIVLHFMTSDIPITCKPRVFKLSDENKLLFRIALADFESFRKSNNITETVITTVPTSFKKLTEVFISRTSMENVSITYTNKTETRIYNKAVAYMRNNIGKSCTINEIAEECCVCATTIKNIFKKYAGQGVNSYFISMKLEKSREYLREGYSAAAVSDMLGFSTQSYFSHVFKKIYGISPIKYKRALSDNSAERTHRAQFSDKPA